MLGEYEKLLDVVLAHHFAVSSLFGSPFVWSEKYSHAKFEAITLNGVTEAGIYTVKYCVIDVFAVGHMHGIFYITYPSHITDVELFLADIVWESEYTLEQD